MLERSRAYLHFGLALALLLLIGAEASPATLEQAQDSFTLYERATTAYEQSLVQEGNTKEQQALKEKVATALKAALSCHRKALERSAPDLETLKDYATLLSRHGDHDQAAKALEHAITLSPENALLHLACGKAHYLTGPGFRQAAFDCFQAALKGKLSEKEQGEAHFFLGSIYREQGLYSLARVQYEEAVALDVSSIRAALGLAVLEVYAGKTEAAENRLKELGNALAPYDVEARVLVRQALRQYQQDRHPYPETAAFYQAYGRLLYRAAMFHEAQLALQRALALAPDHYLNWNLLGTIQSDLGEEEAAITSFKRSLKIEPEQEKIQARVGGIR